MTLYIHIYVAVERGAGSVSYKLFCKMRIYRVKTSAGWIYMASERSGIHLITSRRNISTHKRKPDFSYWFQMFPPFKTFHPSTALLTSVLQILERELTGNHGDPQAVNVHIKTEPLIKAPTSTCADVKTCTLLMKLRSLHSLCVLLVKALPLWGWRKAFSLQDFVNCWK